MQPIGYINSLFTYKNGTPRQSNICQHARGSLSIEKSIFNNPEHSLEGLECYSHIWIIFVFHKNNNQYTKAKVKPPRLNGKRVGLFSTRCPYRPNPIGLTLAKLDKVEGATIHVSGIDLLDGTPVLDIKPYIPEYDYPDVAKSGKSLETLEDECNKSVTENYQGKTENVNMKEENEVKNEHEDHIIVSNFDKIENLMNSSFEEIDIQTKSHCGDSTSVKVGSFLETDSKEKTKINSESVYKERYNMKATNVNSGENCEKSIIEDVTFSDTEMLKQTTENNKSAEIHSAEGSCYSQNLKSKNNNSSKRSKGSEHEKCESGVDMETKTASWITEPPVNKLSIRFTLNAEEQLKHFSSSAEDLNYRLKFLSNTEEARTAICEILREDPRSVYRRKKCEHSLYYFSVDVLHITCWFDECIAEVVRIKPVTFSQYCNKVKT